LPTFNGPPVFNVFLLAQYEEIANKMWVGYMLQQ
jgi:hypothetical protein